MHVPDGILDLRSAGVTVLVSASGVWAALHRLARGLPRRRVPLMGLTGAFLFVAQMLNFPVAGGTSGHLMGSVLAAVLVGPSAAIVVLTSVLLVQCLLFADGGLLALGANVLNMAMVPVLAGYAVFRAMFRVLPGRRGFLGAAAFAAWLSTVLAALVCAAELAAAGVAPWRMVLPAMASVHMVIGLGEAVITTLVLAAILRTRPDLLETDAPAAAPHPTRLAAALAVALGFGVLLFLVPYASSRPDGLEWVAERLGFAGAFAGGGSATATSVAGLLGTVIAFVLAYGLAAAVVPSEAAPARPKA